MVDPTKKNRIDAYHQQIEGLQEQKKTRGEVKGYGQLFGHKVSNGFVNFKISMYKAAISILKRFQHPETHTSPKTQQRRPEVEVRFTHSEKAVKKFHQSLQQDRSAPDALKQKPPEDAKRSPRSQPMQSVRKPAPKPHGDRAASMPQGREPLRFEAGARTFSPDAGKGLVQSEHLNMRNAASSVADHLKIVNQYVDTLAGQPEQLRAALKYGDTDFRKQCEKRIGETLREEYKEIGEPDGKKEFVLDLSKNSPPKLGMLMAAAPAEKNEMEGIVGDSKLEEFNALDEDGKKDYAFNSLKNDSQGLAILMNKLPETERNKLDDSLINKMLDEYKSYTSEDRDAFVLDLALANPEGLRILLKGLAWKEVGSNSFRAQETVVKHLNDAACAQQKEEHLAKGINRVNYKSDRGALGRFVSGFDITGKSRTGSVPLPKPLVMPEVGSDKPYVPASDVDWENL